MAARAAFTWVMDAKSVVTNPSPQAPLLHRGPNVFSGLAWSGRAKIARVDVSLDGGRNWQTARIDGPNLPLAIVRFYVDFDWNGQELMIQSRAMDESGYVQPTKDDLRKVRGLNSIYHNNGIQTWLVRPNGETENVESFVKSAWAGIVLIGLGGVALAQTKKSIGLGREAHPDEIKAWDIDVRPDGQGLACGQGQREAGRGAVSSRNAPPAMASLVRGQGAGRFWRAGMDLSPRRTRKRQLARSGPMPPRPMTISGGPCPLAMPAPLSDDEVYALTAYLLFMNDVVKEDFELSDKNFTSCQAAE